MRENRIRKVIENGGVAVGMLVLEFGTRGIAKLLEYADYDFVTIDMEHSGFGTDRVADLIAMFKATDVTPVVRVPENSAHFIGSALDAGALGIQVANVETAAEARHVVAATKFPPMGRRGIAMIGAHTDFRVLDSSTYLAEANRQTMIIVQIESAEGLRNVDEIAAVDGIDVLAIGFNDMSHALGIVGQLEHPLFLDATERVVAAAKRHGKIAKIHPHSDEQTARYVAQGYRMLMTPVDAAMFRRAAKSSVDNLRSHAKPTPVAGS